jgi:hypothetical protein
MSRTGHFDEQLVRFSIGDRARCEIKHNFPFRSGVSFPYGHIVHALRAGLPIRPEQSKLHNAKHISHVRDRIHFHDTDRAFLDRLVSTGLLPEFLDRMAATRYVRILSNNSRIIGIVHGHRCGFSFVEQSFEATGENSNLILIENAYA